MPSRKLRASQQGAEEHLAARAGAATSPRRRLLIPSWLGKCYAPLGVVPACHSRQPWVLLRAFHDGGGGPPFQSSGVKLNGNLDQLIDAAYSGAKRAASNREKIVFCPPIATFNNSKHAREQDLAEGLALSTECDERAEGGTGKAGGVPETFGDHRGGERRRVDQPGETGEIEPKLHAHYRLKTPARSKDEQKKLKEARRGGDQDRRRLIDRTRPPVEISDLLARISGIAKWVSRGGA